MSHLDVDKGQIGYMAHLNIQIDLDSFNYYIFVILIRRGKIM